MKAIIQKLANNCGYEIRRLERNAPASSEYSEFSQVRKNIADLEKLSQLSLTIPGMITPEAGKFLYTLCYMQDIPGDVVEIGSWQGRSSSFLARAVKESGNGRFYAIDHFGGNVGKEQFYAVDGDLANLKQNFNRNMERLGLSESVNLLDMPNTEAVNHLKDSSIRFLFIDGDHTEEGVTRDIELFFPHLCKGAIVVFDDYFEGFSGLLQAVDRAIEKHKPVKVFSFKHTLVMRMA